MFSSNTCRFVVSLLSLSVSATTAETVRGAPRALLANDMDVPLGTAANYAILAKTGISSVPDSVITGNIAVAPTYAATSITGFGLTVDADNEFSRSEQVNGNVYAKSYEGNANVNKARMLTAYNDMVIAYDEARNKTKATSVLRLNLGEGTLGGVKGGADGPLTPGVYTFDTAVSITGDLHLRGTTLASGPTDVFIIQIKGAVTQAAELKVTLENGVLAENVYWQVDTSFTVGADSEMKGIILAGTNVAFGNKSTLVGRVLTQTACTLDMTTVTQP
jgi:hypothetical protein